MQSETLPKVFHIAKQTAIIAIDGGFYAP